MSLIWVVLGTIFQFLLSAFLFMFSVFAGAGIANESEVSSITLTLLSLSMLILPGLCFLSAGIVIYQYMHEGSSASFWWYAVPPVAAGLYMTIVTKLTS